MSISSLRPTSLPKLLSLLPRSGLHAVIQRVPDGPSLPVTTSPTTITSSTSSTSTTSTSTTSSISPASPDLTDGPLYLITRTKLKFRPFPFVPQPAKYPGLLGAAREKQKAKDAQARRLGLRIPGRDEEVDGRKVGDGEGKELRAYGKAWGMMFRDGQFQPPRHASQLPIQPIPSPTKGAWQHVPLLLLPPQTQENIKNWRATEEQYLAKREEVMTDRKEKWAVIEGEIKERRREKAEEWEEIKRKRLLPVILE